MDTRDYRAVVSGGGVDDDGNTYRIDEMWGQIKRHAFYAL